MVLEAPRNHWFVRSHRGRIRPEIHRSGAFRIRNLIPWAVEFEASVRRDVMLVGVVASVRVI